ncbi:MAG: hypothetical protein IKS05_01400 [Oscillospiraceae bacterium]|nr:hypothetical protein [Oscillospiraceae bacterium]
MRIVDTSHQLLSAFAAGQFDLQKWEAYMDAFVPGAKRLCLEDMREVLKAGFSWEKDFLPVLNAVARDGDKREEAIRSFHRVTDRLDERIRERFGRSPAAELVLYLGLCSGAGWVTEIDRKPVVLFGIEKIMELNWQGENAMIGLVYHELGHVYQDCFGVLRREPVAMEEQLLWQLFTEGVAMVFEQEIAGSPDYFHQYDPAWQQWCGENLGRLKRAFAGDLPTMTHENQRYFGDWVRFEGRGDTGYYLGARFVRFLMEHEDFDSLIGWDLPEVKAGFERFLLI